MLPMTSVRIHCIPRVAAAPYCRDRKRAVFQSFPTYNEALEVFYEAEREETTLFF